MKNKFIKYINRIMKPTNNLSKKIFQAILWALFIPLSTRFASLIRTIILAKLLLPKDFGIYGISIVAISFFETITALNLQEALIQKKQETEEHLNSAWTFQIFRGFFLAIITYIFSHNIANFFKKPEIAFIISIISLTYIFRGFTNIGIIYLQKELEFHKRFIYINIGAFLDIIISICLALIFNNYWALIGGYITSEFGLFIISYFMISFRPKIKFNLQIIKNLLNFGIWLWAASIISFIIVRMDRLVIGKIIGATALGFYIMANRFADITAVNIGKALSSVMFPAYSKVQEKKLLIQKGFLSSLELVLSISLPISLIIIILAPEITLIILGKKWLPCYKIMQILTITAFMRTLLLLCFSLFRGIGKPKLEFSLSLIRAIIIALTIIFFTIKWGIEGTALATLLGALIPVPISIYLILNIIKINFKTLIKNILPLIFSTILMSTSLIISKIYFPTNQLIYFIISITLSLICFTIPLLIYWRLFNIGPIPNFLNYFKSFSIN